MNCPNCKGEMIASLELTGGCSGHPGEDTRCYCDSADCHMEWECKDHKCTVKVKRTRWGYGHYERRERTTVRPDILGDQYAIARFIEKHYKPEETK